MDDVRAVMDAVGSGRAALLGASEGAPMSILFAATYPERKRALVLYGGYAHFHTWVMGEEALARFVNHAETSWGSGATVTNFAAPRCSARRYSICKTARLRAKRWSRRGMSSCDIEASVETL
jgi:pimeloyl-ACP methyl ester carboxylesterase